MNKLPIVPILLLLSSLSFGQNKVHIEKTDCFLDDCVAFANQPNVEFGFLHVPEDYDDPDGRYIKIAYQIVKSTVSNPKPDPILIFQGGWGAPSIGSTGYIDGMPVRNRDIILYDYRGTGYSRPLLCEDLGEKKWQILQEDLNHEAFSEQLSQEFYSCLESLKQSGVDYRHYGTAVKTMDAVKLIEQLGYEEVNLFGISNGTMGIQGFIRASENSSIRIRSIFSDSNVPMKDYMRGDGSLFYKQVLDNILEDCSSDAQCTQTYPNLTKRFYDFLKESMEEPLTYKGEIDIVLNAYEINGIIHQLLYRSNTYKDVPLILEAFINGHTELLDVLLPVLKERVTATSGASLINYTYDWKARQSLVREEYEQTKRQYPEFLWSDFWLDFYASDNIITYNPADTIPVRSDVPALVLAGTYDPITPPEFSRIMHDRYSNSYYYEFPKIGHGVFWTPCGKELLHDFLEEPAVMPDSDCVEQHAAKPIPFITSLYANTSVVHLVQQVAGERNVWWIIALALPLLLSVAYFIQAILGIFKRKDFEPLSFGLFGLLLLFLLALIYYTYQTISLGGMTPVFGLVGGAWWLPWCAPLIILLGTVVLIRMIIKSNYYFWNIGAVVSTILLLFVIVAHDLHPF